MTRVDIVVAVRNEEDAIPVFADKVAALTLPPGVELGVIFVEDSSTDGTRALLGRLATANPRLGYYTVSPGLGQGPAIIFGLSRSTAEAIIMMDVDGSHPVDVVPAMIRAFLEGAQVVQCVRRTLANRKLYRRIGTGGYQMVARLLTGIDPREQLIYYRLVSATIARKLLQQPRYWRYLRFPLPKPSDGTVVRITVDTEERTLGESKYGFWRLLPLAIDGILSQMPWPRRMAALALFVLGSAVLAMAGCWPFALLLFVATLWCLRRDARLRQPALIQQMRILGSANVRA